MEQNNNEKEMLKTGAKLALKAASAPVKTMIWTTILTVLPYLFIGLLLFIVIFCVYFGTLEQVDEIYSGAQSVGERMGNVVSLYGFKTAEELEEDEENKFFKTLQMYKDIFDFSTEDISLLTQTLLYEGSNEEKIYLSEIKKDDGFELFDDEGNFKGKFWTIVKNIITSFQRGFSTSFDGASQFLKANKNLLVPATALRKCKNLANENSKATEQCFRGYLVAEYNTVTDWEIDCNYGKNLLFCDKPIDKDVEPGFLVLPNNIVGEVIAEGNQVFNIMNTFLKLFSKVTIQWGIGQKVATWVADFTKNMREALNLFIFGQLADEEDTHFYYDGYIVENLKEFYKLYNNVCYDDETCNDANDKMNIIEKIKHLMEEYDPEVIKQERQNRRKVADSIIELTETYYELTYGYSKLEDFKFLPNQGSSSFAYGTSCAPISKDDLKYFSSPTNSCSLNSCFGVYGGGWACTPHKGVDINAPSGIYSVCDGTVTMRGMYNDGSASAVEVQCNINGNVYTVRYLHMPMSSVNKWNVGDKVPIGTYIGEQGAVGNGVTGAHLHLDISLNGSYVNPEALVSNCSFNNNCESARNSCQSQGQYYCK